MSTSHPVNQGFIQAILMFVMAQKTLKEVIDYIDYLYI